MSNTPSDAELESLISQNLLVDSGGQCAFESWADIRPELVKFARAVLAKWGTPQPAPDCHHRPQCDECAALAAQGSKDAE